MTNTRFIKKSIKRKPLRESYEDFVIEDGVLVRYRGNDIDIVVPDEVREIGKGAFKECESLTSVTLPQVQKIGNDAFLGCHSLTSVSMPKVVEIGMWAFIGCHTLESVTLPNVQEIGDGVFLKCNALTSVTLPQVKTIGEYTFKSCPALTRVSMPNVQKIDEQAFHDCHSLTSVSMPKVQEIGKWAFYGCTSITSVTLPNVQTIGKEAFGGCDSLTDIDISPSAEIGRWAFASKPIEQKVKEQFGLTESSRNKARTRKDERFVRRAKSIKEADGDMKTYEIVYTVDGTLSKQKVRAASQTEAESLIKERNKGNVVIQTAKEIRGITEDVDKDVRPSPESGAATGIAGMLIDAINDEWETINRYNSMISTIRGMLEDIDNIEGITAGDLQDTAEIIEDINNEENNHVGMLQSALALYSENVETIKDGEKEADDIKTDVADGEVIKDEFADDEYVGRLVKNVKGAIVDA